MCEKQFQAILPLLTAAISDRICAAYHLDEDAAIRSLYASHLYACLEDEETKLWQYSADKLFDLYRQETETGRIDLPEY